MLKKALVTVVYIVYYHTAPGRRKHTTHSQYYAATMHPMLEFSCLGGFFHSIIKSNMNKNRCEGICLNSRVTGN
jgi:hypothetical protein